MDDTNPEPSAAVAPRRDRGARRPAKLAGPAASFLLEFGFRTLYLFLQVTLRFIVIVKREGPPLPKGAVVVAPSHNSFMDPVVMQMSAWRHLSFMMTEIYYNPIWCRWFFQMFRTIPVKEGRGNREALSFAVEALRRNWAVCIFPEGAIAKDGKLQKFQPGVAALAAAVGAPVVPVAVIGTYETFPRHAKIPKLWGKVTVRYGEPIPPPVVDTDESSRKETLRAYAERIRSAVEKLQNS